MYICTRIYTRIYMCLSLSQMKVGAIEATYRTLCEKKNQIVLVYSSPLQLVLRRKSLRFLQPVL